ncbi:hypothetical protein SAMN05444673_3063 [Bacillus sp. OV166]|uniref:CBO0543 family protein n=1 Tax=Bacillus sp. OV166 TaxID=1882763 RepID=UPI000A2AC080|nr:CBO0543 family protein [Bacillus sp. OV166]SMQ77775.1 hypothetical protein SAMN05444673_3063 [Bacillus sp. OV166]
MKTLENPQTIRVTEEFYKKLSDAHYEFLDYWLNHILFHWDFFLSLFLTFLPWVLWLIFRKKESTSRLLFVGFFVLMITSWLDFLGSMYGFWLYSGKAVPTMPCYIPWDTSILPVFAMFLIQYKPNTSPVLKALIFAGVSAFIGEPLFLWLGFYVLIKWSLFYSFPIYCLIYLVCHKLSRVNKFAEI